MEFAIINNSRQPIDPQWEIYFGRICEKCTKLLALKDNGFFSVIFVDDEEIRRINREYRHIDRTTDVISFAARENSLPFELEEEEMELGDIFICVDALRRQAADYGHSELRESCFLLTHGILHLLGYDHLEPEDEKTMFRLQDEILDGIINR